MARSLNRVTLIGNLGADPELRSTPQGTSVATMRIATTESYKDKNGEWQENTEWHNIELWTYLADRAGQYLKKGDRVYIEGKLQTDSYEKDGVQRYFTKVKATNMILLTPKETGEGVVSEDSPNYDTNDKTQNEEDDVPF